MKASEVELFFDIGSAYSYLAATQMAALTERTGASVRWRPFLLGGVFKAVGNEMPARVPAKAQWMLSDLKAWAGVYGIPFSFPTTFPLNTLKTQRALVAQSITDAAKVPALALSLFEGYWVHDRDVSSPEVIAQIAAGVGCDGDSLVAALDHPATKSGLREETDEAVRRGAFGAPAMFVGDRLFWGNDRLPLVERALTGRE